VEKVEELVERDTYALLARGQDAERDYREIVEHIPAAARRLVEDFLGRTPPAEPHAAAFCHRLKTAAYCNRAGTRYYVADELPSTIT
jgi:hypothetical protein